MKAIPILQSTDVPNSRIAETFPTKKYLHFIQCIYPKYKYPQDLVRYVVRCKNAPHIFRASLIVSPFGYHRPIHTIIIIVFSSLFHSALSHLRRRKRFCGEGSIIRPDVVHSGPGWSRASGRRLNDIMSEGNDESASEHQYRPVGAKASGPDRVGRTDSQVPAHRYFSPFQIPFQISRLLVPDSALVHANIDSSNR